MTLCKGLGIQIIAHCIIKMSCIEKSLSFSFTELPSFPTRKESNLGVVEYVSVRKSIRDTNHSRGRCQRFLDEDWFAIGKYGAVYGLMAAAKRNSNQNFPTSKKVLLEHSEISIGIL